METKNIWGTSYTVCFSQCFDKNKEEYAQLATREMGKVIGQSRKEIENVLWYADIMQKMQLHY
jgi:acyl-CoA reductase-like NAD-dependent aldehyde dehydrogenase